MRAHVAVTLLSLSWAVAHGLQGEMNRKRSDEQERLMRTGDQVRKQLGESGRFRIAASYGATSTR